MSVDHNDPRIMARNRLEAEVHRLRKMVCPTPDDERTCHAKAEEDLGRLREAGRALATCAFNLKQRSHFTDAERHSLAESQEHWDFVLADIARARSAADATIEDLIDRSSLGTPEAKAIRAAADPKAVEEIMRRVHELDGAGDTTEEDLDTVQRGLPFDESSTSVCNAALFRTRARLEAAERVVEAVRILRDVAGPHVSAEGARVNVTVSASQWPKVDAALRECIAGLRDYDTIKSGGTVETFGDVDAMVNLNGKTFRCNCGANVFKKSATGTRFKCNGCGATYTGDPVKEATAGDTTEEGTDG